jgi:hypothetical protein
MRSAEVARAAFVPLAAIALASVEVVDLRKRSQPR